jgi:hypothetical protein
VGWLTATWVIASYGVVLAVLLMMFVVASPFYYRLRDGLEGTEKVHRLEDEALLQTLQSRRPEALLAVGGSGLLVLIWLMAVRPG